MWQPTRDGALIPDHPYHPAAPAISNHIPVMIGTTFHESSPSGSNARLEEMDEGALKTLVAQTFKDRASVICYAGTTNERAQDTLDVTLGELKRLIDGIDSEEVERVRAGLKSSLIMQEESTSARAGTPPAPLRW